MRRKETSETRTHEVGRVELLRSSCRSDRGTVTGDPVCSRRVNGSSDDTSLSLKHLLLLLG